MSGDRWPKKVMGEPEYRPLDVLVALEALGVDEDVQVAFYVIAEDFPTMGLKQTTNALKSAGMSNKARVAVLKRLGGPAAAAPPPGDKPVMLPMSPVATGPLTHHEARRPQLVFLCGCVLPQ